jgi:hypothetical protein
MCDIFIIFALNTALIVMINKMLHPVIADGTWSVAVPPHAAGGPIDFEIIHVKNYILKILKFQMPF